MITNFIILVVLLVLSAFFSASEVAFISLSDAKVESMVKKKFHRAKKIKKLKSNPRRLLVTILIGNNIVNIAAASLATVVTSTFFDSGAIGIATGVMTLLVLIFGEIIPKSYATNHNKRFAALVVPYLSLLQAVLLPLVIIFEWLTNLFAGAQGPEYISEEELKAMARAGAKQGSIESREGVMIERLFQFNDITAEDIMTPRIQMVYLEDTLPIKDAVEYITSHPHTRFPIVKNSPDEVTGFVHSRDVLVSYLKKKKSTIKDVAHPILRVPKQLPIDSLLKEFQKAQVHLAVVLDEYGGTEGVVTLEDVLEELVGEITDEHDVDGNLIQRIDKTTIIVHGDEQVRDINTFLNVSIPGNPLDTIAEIMLDAIEKIPRKNMSIELENTTCTVLEVTKRVITKVKVEKK